MPALDLLTIGRVGVDLYPLQTGPLKDVSSFRRYLGGTATNVAVAAARLGRRTAVLTKVGPDGFGVYVRQALDEFGVDPAYVGTAEGLLTPVVFCELDPPEDPPLLFYRPRLAPDLTLTHEDVPWDLVDEVPVLWVTGSGFCTDPSKGTHRQILDRRSSQPPTGRHTVFDLDWRRMFWASPDVARREYEATLNLVTVVVGNLDEVEVAVGTRDPDAAADRLLEHGVELALVKMGAEGVLVATAHERSVVPPHPVAVVCGLGAGDAFGGALVHGLLAGWEPTRIAAYANAAGAIVASRLACADAMPWLNELESLVGAEGVSS